MSAGSSGGEGYFSSRYSRIASDWNSVVPSSSTSAGSAICGLILRYSGLRCALASRSTKITSAGTFFRLSAMRTRKLASDRQKEKNFMEAPRILFPSPLVGEGGSIVLRTIETGEGFFPRIETPHPARTSSAPPSPTTGEGKKVALRPHGLLPPGQMHRTGASGRMRGDIVGGDDLGHRRRLRRGLFLRRNVIQHRRQPALGLGHRHALARGIILDLVALDLADAEIETLGMGEIKPRHRRARPHCKALGQLHASRVLRIEQAEQRRLLGVIGLRGIAGRRADAGILLEDELIRDKRLVRRVAPELLAHALMHP